MAFDRKYSDYGVIKVKDNSLHVYSDGSNYVVVDPGRKILDARWAGDSILINFVDGTTRRYTDKVNYTVV